MNGPKNTLVRTGGYLLGQAIEKEGGRVTSKIVLIVVGALVLAGLAFVAYRLLVLNLILDVLRERG